MFGKVEAAFAESSSALWAESEKPIDATVPSSKRREARTSPARGPGLRARKTLSGKTCIQLTAPCQALDAMRYRSGICMNSASQCAIADSRVAFDHDPVAYSWPALLRTGAFMIVAKGAEVADIPIGSSRRGMAERMTVR